MIKTFFQLSATGLGVEVYPHYSTETSISSVVLWSAARWIQAPSSLAEELQISVQSFLGGFVSSFPLLASL